LRIGRLIPRQRRTGGRCQTRRAAGEESPPCGALPYLCVLASRCAHGRPPVRNGRAGSAAELARRRRPQVRRESLTRLGADLTTVSPTAPSFGSTVKTMRFEAAVP